MLGITTPDAIAFGMMVLAALAAWRGMQTGESAKKSEPPPPTPLSLGMATFADTAMMSRLVDAIDRHADAIHRSIEANDKRQSDTMAQRLAELSKQIEQANRRKDRD
jgi:hypothetical protein